MKRMLVAILAVAVLGVRAAHADDVLGLEVVSHGAIVAPFGANKLDIVLDRKTGNVDLWVTASVSFRIEWSGDLVSWAEMHRQEVKPNTTHLIVLRDHGWARFTTRGFYRMVFVGVKPPGIDEG